MAVTLDHHDRAMLQALHRDPRASFAAIGAELGLSERTIARRLERLLAVRAVRFIARLIPEYLEEGLVAELAVRCAPGRLDQVGRALARLPETRSVEVATGDPVVLVEVIVDGADELMRLIDRTMAHMDGVLDVHTAVVLRLVLHASDWAPFAGAPTRNRRAVIAGDPLPPAITIDSLDRQLVAILQDDARTPMSRIAAQLHVGESTARRRLARLMGSHVFHLRLLVDPSVLGYPLEGRFELEIEHSAVDRAIRHLAAAAEIRHLVVTTGRLSVLGYSSHAGVADYRAFVTRVFAPLPGLRSARTALLLRSYKRAGWGS